MKQLLKSEFILSLAILAMIVATLPLLSSHVTHAYAGSPSSGEAITNCPQPPQNVNLMTLSDAQLDLYGLPTHSMINRNPQVWTSVLAHATHRTCGSYPDPLKRSHRPVNAHHFVPAISCSGCYSKNWSGNVDYGQRGTYRDGSVNFTVPSINGAFSPSNSDVSTWVGVGGDSDFTSPIVLVQAGVDVYKACSVCPQYNESFYEVWPNQPTEQNLPLCRLNTGDQVYAFIDSNDNNNGKDYFYISNVSANCYNSYTIRNSSYFSDSATGECIVERPTNTSTGGYYQLGDFGTIHLTGCTIDTNTQVNGVGNYPHVYYTMTSDGTSKGNVLAYPGSITGGGYDFPVYWRASA